MTAHRKLRENAEKLYLAQEWNEALSLYQWLYVQEPCNANTCAVLGEIHACLGHTTDGIEFFQKAIDLLTAEQKETDQTYLGTVYFLQGLCFINMGKRRQAVHVLTEAAKYKENWAEPYLKLGNVYFESGEHQLSLETFQKAAEITPEDGSVWLTIAYINHLLNRPEVAETAARKVLALDPNSEQATYFLAESLRKTGKTAEAVPYFELVIRANQSNIQALYGYGQALLACGELSKGWPAYEARRLCESGTWNRHYLPDWNGEEDPWHTVLIYGEGGISREILYASCLADMTECVGHCYVECDRALHSLFARSFPNVTLVNPTDSAFVSDEYPGMYFDSQVAFGSMPRFFRSDLQHFPVSRRSYLVPDKAKVQNWKRRFSEKDGQLKIGVLFEGAWGDEPAEQCRIPLDVIARIVHALPADSTHWISLQHGNQKETWQTFRKNLATPISHFQEAFAYNLDELAALIASLDYVIAPSGVQAHLAAALGVPCWVVLPHCCDWHWHLARDYSPWYPSVRLFRQSAGETWEQTTQTLISELHLLLDHAEGPIIFPFPQPSKVPSKTIFRAG